MEESYSTGILLSVEVKLNLTLGIFHEVLEKMCHIEDKIQGLGCFIFFVGIQVIKHMVPLIRRM